MCMGERVHTLDVSFGNEFNKRSYKYNSWALFIFLTKFYFTQNSRIIQSYPLLFKKLKNTEIKYCVCCAYLKSGPYKNDENSNANHRCFSQFITRN